MHTLNKKVNVIFRVQTNNVGFGHVKRCISLAEAFLKQNAEVTFFIDENEQAEAFLTNWHYVCTHKEEQFFSYVEHLQAPTIIIIDGAFATESYVKQLKSNCEVNVVIIDVNKEGRIGADFLINTAPYALTLYEGMENALLGPAYTILSDDLMTAPMYEPKKPLIVVSLGGTLYKNYNDFFLALAANMPMYEFVIIGPSETYKEAFVDNNVTYIPQLPNIFSYLKAATLAVIGGGTTIYEAVALEKRCLVLPLNEAQQQAATWWAENGYLHLYTGELIESDIQECIVATINAAVNANDVVNINGKHMIVEQILKSGVK